jgi:hypothetical protein
MIEIKPGRTSSEYYLTLGLNAVIGILMALALVGLIAVDQQENYMKAAEAIFLGVGPLAMTLITAVYTHGRANVKKAQIESGLAEPEVNNLSDAKEPFQVRSERVR